jgi:hypothetical protein
MPYSPYPDIIRLRPMPDEPAGPNPARIVGPRPNKSRRPYPDSKVAEVRRLIEQTTLTYVQIEAKTGVSAGLACIWKRNHGWTRPPFAARATDMVPRERASAQLRRRWLGYRLSALAERAVRELEASPNVNLDDLAEAIELFKMAKLAAGHRKRGAAVAVALQSGQAGGGTGSQVQDGKPQDSQLRNGLPAPKLFDAMPREVMQALRAAGIDVQTAPEAALEDFIDSRAPSPKRNLTPRQRREKWMRERE